MTNLDRTKEKIAEINVSYGRTGRALDLIITECLELAKKVDKKESRKINCKSFNPPNFEEVRVYFQEKGYSPIAGLKAWEYYNEANWIDSKGNKIINWKQKMIGVWFKDENKIQPTVTHAKNEYVWNK